MNDNSNGEKDKTYIVSGNQIEKAAWLKDKQNFEGKDEYGYGKLDIENAPTVTREEESKLLAEERSLRLQLNKVNSIHPKSLDEMVEWFKANNMIDILLEWKNVHMRNRAIIMKKGGVDILITPETQAFLKAAEMLQH